jgi:hypothetical protein
MFKIFLRDKSYKYAILNIVIPKIRNQKIAKKWWDDRNDNIRLAAILSLLGALDGSNSVSWKLWLYNYKS